MRDTTKALLVLAAAAVLSTLVAEGALRLVTNRSAFLDPSTDTYWLALESEQSDSPPENPDIAPDPELGWRMKPSHRSNLANHDEQGFRFTTPGTGDAAVVVGDSFTYGLGVLDDETYASELAKITGLSIVNAGTNAYGIDQALLKLERHIDDVDPRVIVLGYFVDDFDRNGLSFRDAAKPRFVRTDDEYVIEPPREQNLPFGLRVVETAGYVTRRLGFYDEQRFSEAIALSDYLLARLRGLAESVGATLVVLLIQHCYEGQPQYLRVETSVLETCDRLGLQCINTAEAMRGTEWQSFYGDNCHWSPKGHRLAAQLVSERLSGRGVFSR